MHGVIPYMRGRLTEPVDNTFLVYLRIAFGGLLIFSLVKYFNRDLIWTQFLEPQIHFTYYGFEWIKPWPGRGMYVHFLVTAVAAACTMLGFCYRLFATIFFLAFTFIFLIDESWYLNHYYLICLLSFVMILVPAERAFSVDVLRGRCEPSDVAPAWALWLLRFQVGLPYFFGGIAKLNSDWLYGEPLRTWLAGSADFPLIGQYFTQEWCVSAFVWGGLLLDLLAVPLLLWRSTRLPVLALVWVFHGLNAQLFDIGVFPWLMLAATTLLFVPTAWTSQLRFWKRADPARPDAALRPTPGWVAGLVCGFVALQLLLPLRHYLYPGDVAFTREGHCFSWRMKLNIREVDMQLAIVYDDGTREPVRLWEWLTYPQSRRIRSNDQLLLLAREIRERKEQQTGKRAEVRGTVTVALNRREPALLVSDEVDLSRQPRGLLPAPWIHRPVLPTLSSQAAATPSPNTPSPNTAEARYE